MTSASGRIAKGGKGKPRRRPPPRPAVLQIPPSSPFLVVLLSVSAILLVSLRPFPLYAVFWRSPFGGVTVLGLFRIVWALATVYGALDLVIFHRRAGSNRMAMVALLAVLGTALLGLQVVSFLL